jgi:hypothetical protein
MLILSTDSTGGTMMEEPKEDPAKKMRKLLGGTSPFLRLPKKNGSTQKEEVQKETPINALIKQNKKQIPTPRASKTNVKPATPAVTGTTPASNVSTFFGPRFWTIASVISLSINAITALVLLIVVITLLSNGLSISSLISMGDSLLGGLYTNFEKMDRASIQTNVEVNTTIPVKFDLQLNQQTNVVLSQDVTIENALVTVNTGGLNITRGNTTIILPQGTTLPVVLNLTVPVDTTVPVTLNVPVNIPLNETELHEPFTGLQDVVRPFYCMINSNAINLIGEPVCR